MRLAGSSLSSLFSALFRRGKFLELFLFLVFRFLPRNSIINIPLFSVAPAVHPLQGREGAARPPPPSAPGAAVALAGGVLAGAFETWENSVTSSADFWRHHLTPLLVWWGHRCPPFSFHFCSTLSPLSSMNYFTFISVLLTSWVGHLDF